MQYNLERYRKLSKLNQNEVAEMLSITQPTLSSYENERTQPTFDILIKMSNIYNVSIDELLGNNNFIKAKENAIVVPEEKKEVVNQLLSLSEQHFKFIATEIQTCLKLNQAI